MLKTIIVTKILKELGIMTFGQRFKIINAGKLLASGTANGTGVMNNEKDALMGSPAFSSDNVMEEDIMNVPTNSFESAENSEEPVSQRGNRVMNVERNSIKSALSVHT